MFNVLETVVRRSLESLKGETLPGTLVRFKQAPPEKGNLMLACGDIAKAVGVPLPTVVDTAVAALRGHSHVRSVEKAGAFVNVRLSRGALFDEARRAAHTASTVVRTPASERHTVMVEYLSPNTNKPLHLGHVRNGVLGTVTANLLDAVGHHVIRANLLNDRGAAICKSMVGYRRFAQGASPQTVGKKGDHFVGDLYVSFSQASKEDPSFEQEAQAMLELWEAGDEATRTLWKQMNEWVYAGFAATCKRYGFSHDVEYFESNLYTLGKDIVQQGVETGVFEQLSDGAVVYKLPVEKFGTTPDKGERTAVLLRGNGTSLYLTQDLGTAVKKAQEHNLDRSIYVVASEQKSHFQQLFDMLKSLGYPWVDRCHHLSYGMVELPEGRMKSREGTVVDADDLLDGMVKLSEEIVRSKNNKLSSGEVRHRAERIALAAIKFYLLLYSSDSTVRFNPQKSLAFEGDTGPYCLYTYARIQSILRRGGVVSGSYSSDLPFISVGDPTEEALALSFAGIPDAVVRAAEGYNPSLLAQQVLALAKAFNRFYTACPVISDDRELTEERLELCVGAGKMLRWGLGLLGIEVLDQM